MSNMAEYARIFETGSNDDWVEKRKKSVSDIRSWFEKLSPGNAIIAAASIAASINEGSQLPDAIADMGQAIIQRHASSFVRLADQGELQIKVILFAAAIEFVNSAPKGDGWTPADALAAAFWSALSIQRPLNHNKVEKLRQDLLVASRERVLMIAEAARQRSPIPPIGPVNIAQNSDSSSKVNLAFSRAVEPMVSTMRDNAALDREELDFMWWLLSDRSDILDEPLAGLPDAVRAVVAGLDAAAKLRKLPANAHRNIVLRNVKDNDPLSLTELISLLGNHRTKLIASFGAMISGATAAFPLMTAIATGSSGGPFDGEKFAASEWGARALLEGALHHRLLGTAGGL